MKLTREILLIMFLAINAWGIPAITYALDLEQAKAQGLVGEQPDGYLGVVKATPEAVALAADINKKRRAAYEDIARKNGITVEQVAVLAGEKAIARTAPGNYIRTPDGRWIRK